jgi:LemA protein
MKKTPIALVLATTAAVSGFGTLAAQDLQQHDQAVLARWAELHAAEQAQFAEVPAVLTLADTQPAVNVAVRDGARARCGLLAQFDGGAPLIDDAQRFDRYKQVRAECTGALFRLLATLRGDPLLAADGHVQALGLSLTQGQTSVDDARARYREALAAYNQGVNQLPRGVAAALLGYQERPDFVRHANAGS